MPQAPKVDLAGLNRAFQQTQQQVGQISKGFGQGLDISKRTFLGQQLTPYQQSLINQSPDLRALQAVTPRKQEVMQLFRSGMPALDIGLAIKEKGLGAFTPQEIMQRGMLPALTQQVSKTGQRIIATPEGQMLQKQPGLQGQISRGAETAFNRPQEAITGTLKVGAKTIGEAPGVKEFNKTQVGKVLSNYVVDPTVQSFIDTFGRVDRKSTRLNSSHVSESRMPSSA